MSFSANIFVDSQKEIEEKEIEVLSHPAWHGDLSGMETEDILRGLPPGSYLLREGERRFQYYLSCVLENPFTFKHQPFQIPLDHPKKIWSYRNATYHWASELKTLIPLIMHCNPENCYAILKKAYES